MGFGSRERKTKKAIQDVVRGQKKYWERKHDQQNAAVASALNAIADHFETYKKQEGRSEKTSNLLSVITIVVIFATAFFAALQWLVFRKQVDDFESESRVRLRAYVFAIPPGNPKLEIDKKAEWGMQIQTTGQTPAYEVSGWAAISIQVHPLWEAINLEKSAPGNAFERNQSFLHPGIYLTIPVATSFDITQQQLDALKAGPERIHIWGRADYSDVFGCWHVVTFCYSHRMTGPGAPANEPCAQYNDADREPEKCSTGE